MIQMALVIEHMDRKRDARIRRSIIARAGARIRRAGDYWFETNSDHRIEVTGLAGFKKYLECVIPFSRCEAPEYFEVPE